MEVLANKVYFVTLKKIEKISNKYPITILNVKR